LTELLRDFGVGLVRQACDELGIDARRTNMNALRRHLNEMEARIK
jgi:uridylate kinase